MANCGEGQQPERDPARAELDGHQPDRDEHDYGGPEGGPEADEVGFDVLGHADKPDGRGRRTASRSGSTWPLAS
jgi:hypothetical protein